MKGLELRAACPAKCVAHRSPRYLLHGILHRSLAGAAEGRPRLYCSAGRACGIAAMPGGYAPWCLPHPQFFLAWRADPAATCVATCFYPAIPAPPGLVMRRQSSLGFSRTSTMQAISGGGDPATIYMYPIEPPRLVMRASFFSWLVALIDGA
jgi:hypothetical protein